MSHVTRDILIRASAGTGKTFQLSNRYLGLVARGERLSGILATTFTRKAAGEILDRVLCRLAEAAEDDAKCDELASFILDGQANLTRRDALRLLRNMLTNLHRLRVSTLDAFFVQLARSFSLELGLPPGWQVIDEIDDVRLRLETGRAMLRRAETNDVVRLMQLLGKGDVGRKVTDEILSLVAALYPMFLESDEEAWKRLQRRETLSESQIAEAIEQVARVELPKHKSIATRREKDVALARIGDWETFLANGYPAAIIAEKDEYYRKPITIEIENAYAPLIAHARATLLNMFASQTEASHELLSRFDQDYASEKLRNRRLRFEDVVRLLTKSGLMSRLDDVAYRMDGDVHHLLLDEFQDTSPLQWAVLRPFAQRTGTAKSHADARSFFCVGDMKQAIYGWRGGVAELFDVVESELTGLERQSLDQSFRSSPPVIETVNRVFEPLSTNDALNRDAGAAIAWAKRYHSHATARKQLPGFCQLLTAPADEDQKSATLMFAADQIARLHGAAPDKTVGVLVRKNKTVGRLIYLLRSRGIHASEEGGNPLTDSDGVNLVLSLLSLADHPGDTAARFHVATSCLGPKVGLTDHASDAQAAAVSLALRRDIANDGYGPALRRWCEHLCATPDERESARLEQFLELAHAYDVRSTNRVDDFIDFVRRQRVESPTSAAVRVMTVHQSKGLQFDMVVLPELDERLAGQPPTVVGTRPSPAEEVDRVLRYVGEKLRPLLPQPFQEMFDIDRGRTVEEALCLLYVALTRAVHGLFMITSPPGKSLPATFAGVLRSALCDGDPLSDAPILFEYGDPRWMEKCTRPMQEEPTVAPSEPSKNGPMAIRLRKSATVASRGLERTSPSQLEGGRRASMSELLQIESSGAAEWGTAIHALFEHVRWLDETPPTEASLRAALSTILSPGDDPTRIIEAFQRMCRRPIVHRVLSAAAYRDEPRGDLGKVGMRAGIARPRWEVQTERNFAIVHEQAILRGTIDRLTILYDGDRAVAADVLDFKTDRFDADDEQAVRTKTDFYRPQLEAYRDAVSKLYGLSADAVSMRLLFVTPGVLRVL